MNVLLGQIGPSWDLQLKPDIKETPHPTSDELEALSQIDPDGFWS